MQLSARQLNRALLARQLLLRREPVSVVDALRRIVAIQAQEPASPFVALWNRVSQFDPGHVDDAFAQHTVVKASLMRATLHAVHADDYPAFYGAMVSSLRAARLNDRRFASTSLTAELADAALERVVDFAAVPRAGAELDAAVKEWFGDLPEPGLWWVLRTCAPLVHAPSGGPWTFGLRPAYVAAPAGPRPVDRMACIKHLVLRYLEGFGPASVTDIAQFTRLSRTAVRAAVEQLAAQLQTVNGPDGELLDVPGGARPAGDVPAPPRLMAMWDSTLLAHADRSRIIPPAYRRVVIRQNGDVLPTLLVDGYVAGVWRALPDGRIEATAFHRLSSQVWEQLATEAAGLRSMLVSREPAVYRRYARWWTDLPATEIRLLAAG